MAQQDKDREAFELAWEKSVLGGHTYPAEAKEWAFLGWQAARGHYASTPIDVLRSYAISSHISSDAQLSFSDDAAFKGIERGEIATPLKGTREISSQN